MTTEAMDLLRRGLEQLAIPWTQAAEDKLGLYCARLLEKTR